MCRMAVAVLVLLLSACQGFASGPAASSPPFAPIGSSPADLPSMRGALLVRAYSGTIQSDDERSLTTPAELVVLQSGEVIADVGEVFGEPEYLRIQLTPAELADLTTALERIMPVDEPRGLAPNVGDLDAGTTVLQARRSDGRAVELLAPGLSSAVMSQEALAQYSPASVALDRLATGLLLRVKSEGTAGDELASRVPEVRTAPYSGG